MLYRILYGEKIPAVASVMVSPLSDRSRISIIVVIFHCVLDIVLLVIGGATYSIEQLIEGNIYV